MGPLNLPTPFPEGAPDAPFTQKLAQLKEQVTQMQATIAEQQLTQLNVEQRKVAMEPMLQQLAIGAREAKEMAKNFKMTEFVRERADLARTIGEAQKLLSTQGIADNHAASVELHELRKEMTPNYAVKSGANIVDFAKSHPWLGVAGVASLYFANRVLAKATGDGFWGKVARWTGLGFLATLAVNHYTEKERRAKAAMASQPTVVPEAFPTSPDARALAMNLEGNVPQVAWSRTTPDGTVQFRYPNIPQYPMGMPYGPQMPNIPMPPQPLVGPYYFNPGMPQGRNAPPPFYRAPAAPYPSYTPPPISY